MSNTKRWIIYDGMPGECFDDKAKLLAALTYETASDVQVLEFDHAEIRADGRSLIRDVSEDIAHDYYEAHSADAFEAIVAGKTRHDLCGLLQRYYADRISWWEGSLNAYATKADYDNDMAAA